MLWNDNRWRLKLTHASTCSAEVNSKWIEHLEQSFKTRGPSKNHEYHKNLLVEMTKEKYTEDPVCSCGVLSDQNRSWSSGLCVPDAVSEHAGGLIIQQQVDYTVPHRPIARLGWCHSPIWRKQHVGAEIASRDRAGRRAGTSPSPWRSGAPTGVCSDDKHLKSECSCWSWRELWGIESVCCSRWWLWGRAGGSREPRPRSSRSVPNAEHQLSLEQVWWVGDPHEEPAGLLWDPSATGRSRVLQPWLVR